MSTVAEVENVVSEVSVAVASVSEQTDFPRFAKRAKTRDFAQLSSEVPAMSKLQSSQLDQRGHACSKIQYAQPISVEKSSSSKTRQVLEKVKRERTGRVPGIIETKPRMQRQTSRPEPILAEAEPQRWHIGADVNPPWQWNARHGGPCGSRTSSTPFPFWHPYGHVLLCSLSQCCGQEARCLH